MTILMTVSYQETGQDTRFICGLCDYTGKPEYYKFDIGYFREIK